MFIKNKIQFNRPLSPHLTIYQPQLTSVLSIFHRATGIILSFVLFGAVLWYAITNLFAFSYMVFWLNLLVTKITLFIKLIVFTCLSYHFCNGIRHLLWDFGYFLELDGVYLSGKIMLLSTAILVAIYYCFGLTDLVPTALTA